MTDGRPFILEEELVLKLHLPGLLLVLEVHLNGQREAAIARLFDNIGTFSIGLFDNCKGEKEYFLKYSKKGLNELLYLFWVLESPCAGGRQPSPQSFGCWFFLDP